MANVHNKTDTVKSTPKAGQLGREGGAAEPTSGRKNESLDTEQFCTAKPTVHWVSNGWTCMDWEGSDGQPGGYVVTNGQSAMFFDDRQHDIFHWYPWSSRGGGRWYSIAQTRSTM